MQTHKERLTEITYEIYSKEHIISFEDYFDKIVNDEDFNDEFHKLWEDAKKIDMDRRRK